VKHSHAGGYLFSTFLTDWLRAVCGVVVLLPLVSHLVVIAVGRKKNKKKLYSGSFLGLAR